MDIEHLSEKELIDLNRKIVDRLKLIEANRNNNTMMRFSKGDRVSFEPETGRVVNGILVKFNTKTVRILTDDGETWNVSPRFLTLLERPIPPKKSRNVIPLSPK